MAEINVNLGGARPVQETRRRVRFSDVDLLATYHLHDDASSTTSNHEDASPYTPSSSQKNFKIRERRSQASLASDFRGRYLSIQPGDELVFERRQPSRQLISQSNDGADLKEDFESSDVIRLVNIASGYVAFKVKTTAPEKYRVRPSFGCIEAGGSKTVEVTIQPGYLTTATRDRFLIMSVPLAEEPKNHDDLVDYWRELLKNGILHAEVEEHRLHSTVVAPPADVLVAQMDGCGGQRTSADQLDDRLGVIDSKLEFLIGEKKTALKKRQKMKWNLLSFGFVVVFLFFSSRVFMFVFTEEKSTSSSLNYTATE